MTRETAEQLERIVKRLDRANVRLTAPRDDLLAMLTRLGETGLPIGIGMLVDGAVIAGAVQPPSVLGNALSDAAVEAMVAFGWSDEATDEIAATIRELEPRIAEVQDDAAKVAEKYPVEANVDTVEGADIFDFYRAFVDSGTVDLQNAVMTLPGHAEPIQLKSLRVNIAHIAAWWPLSAQDGATVTYSPISPD